MECRYCKHGCRFPEEVLGGRIRRYYAEVLKNQEEKT